MRGPETPRDPQAPRRDDGTAMPGEGADSLRATQPLPGRPAEAGEAVGHVGAQSPQSTQSAQSAQSAQQGTPTASTPGQLAPSHFLSERDCGVFRQRWLQVQAGFIDRPEETVEEADRLLGDVLERFTHGLAVERDSLAARWRAGSTGADTEDLRLALQGYRSLLERLLGS